MTEGKFIAFEGVDGSGLTTQAELLRAWFKKEQKECRVTKEPSELLIGGLIKEVLAKRRISLVQGRDLEHWLGLLFAADRQDHLANVILPTLEKGIHVITDRYYLSSFAYQGLGVELESLRVMNARCRAPDLAIFLNVPVEICKKRIERERWHTDLYEEVAKLEMVREKFLETIQRLTLEGERIEIVNGNDSPQAVHRSVLALVRKLVNKNHAPDTRQLPLDAAVREAV
jgi:dTMP kinase